MVVGASACRFGQNTAAVRSSRTGGCKASRVRVRGGCAGEKSAASLLQSRTSFVLLLLLLLLEGFDATVVTVDRLCGGTALDLQVVCYIPPSRKTCTGSISHAKLKLSQVAVRRRPVSLTPLTLLRFANLFLRFCATRAPPATSCPLDRSRTSTVCSEPTDQSISRRADRVHPATGRKGSERVAERKVGSVRLASGRVRATPRYA